MGGPEGNPVDVERPGLERSVTRVGDNGRPRMALVDHALREHLEFVDAAGSVALFALENERLTGSLRSALRELEGSRARIVAAADRERRLIERDLHDGAQQRLVALRIKLKLADELVDAGRARTAACARPSRRSKTLWRMCVHWHAASIRRCLPTRGSGRPSLGRPSCPLVHDGRVRWVGSVSTRGRGAVYFSCLEALQNAVKHAHGARSVGVVDPDER